MNQIVRIAVAAAISVSLAAISNIAIAAEQRPNVVVIVADDLGYADVGFHGCKDVPTPNIDSLAKNGVQFSNGYVSCPVCSPTRAGLNTGRYQQRFGHEFNPGGRTPPEGFGLPLTEITLAQQMKAAGYATGMVGKWHLGENQMHPLKRGFDSFYGFLGAAHPYQNLKADQPNPIMRGTTPIDESEYLTDAFTREAVAFITAHQKEPFYLYLPYNAAHSPQQAPDKYVDRFKGITEKRRRMFAAMLSAMDDGIGNVMKALRDANVEENTLVFFVSDNGGPTGSTTSRNDPLKGVKSQVWEGGIREPFAVQWKAVLPKGKTYNQPVIALDIFPTVLTAAGGKIPDDRPIDGVNLLPYLKGEKTEPPHESLYWRFGAQSAVRRGNWKLVVIGNDPPQLFDLAADIGEKQNVAADKPELVKELTDAYAKWNSQMKAPLWGGGRNTAASRPARQPRARQP